MVGRLYPVSSPNSGSDKDSEGASEVAEVRTLGTTKSDSDDNHWEKLCKVLRVSDGIPDTKHGPFNSKMSKFYDMLKPYANVFVFEDGQLGSTNIVTHSINTGDSALIRQPPRCIPFALRKKVEQLVEDMIQKKVVHPSKSLGRVQLSLLSRKMEKQGSM